MRQVLVIGGIAVLALIAAGIFFVVRMRADAAPGGPGGPGGEGMGFEPAEAVEVLEAAEVPWQPTADLVGTVFAIRSVTVRNELPGVVRVVGFDSGSLVEPGQVLLQQDDTTARADLEAARASVRVAESNVVQADAQERLAEIELRRITEVGSRGIAQVELDRANARLDTARADRTRWLAEVDQAKARVAQLESRLDKLTLTAPFRARAGMRTVHEGQYLAEGVDVVALQEVTDRIYLDFAIAQDYAPRVQVGTRVMATGDLLGPDPVPIEVVATDAAVNYDTRNLRVRAIVDNPRGTLVPGMFVQVRVPIDTPQRFVMVPSTAVRRSAYANSVYVIAPDGKEPGAYRAHQRFVKLGSTVGEDVIVLEGVQAGERIAAAGSFKLRDGAKVMLGPPGGPPAAGPPSATGTPGGSQDAPPEPEASGHASSKGS